MATTPANVIGDTAARILRTQALAAGGAAALQLRRTQALGVVAGMRNFDPLAALSGAWGATPKIYPVTVEKQAPEPRPTYGPSKAELCAFIFRQMIEAQDEAAQAACCRYILRNHLIG